MEGVSNRQSSTGTRNRIANSAGYRAAREGVTVEIPGGLRIEIYRRRDGGTECSWLPMRPDFKRREVRSYVLPHYDALVAEFEERFGMAGEIRNAAYGPGSEKRPARNRRCRFS